MKPENQLSGGVERVSAEALYSAAMETFTVVDLTAESVPLARVERLPAATRAVVLPFPPARDARAFGRLLRAVKRAKVAAVLAHPLLCRPCWAKAMEWLASEVLGPIERLELDLRTACPGAEPSSSIRPSPADGALWPALDFALRLPFVLPRLVAHGTPHLRELCSEGDAVYVRLTWGPSQDAAPAERLFIQAANGRLELVAGHHSITTARMVLTAGHEATEEFSEVPSGQVAHAWAHHAVSHGLDGGPLSLGRLSPLYAWLARP